MQLGDQEEGEFPPLWPASPSFPPPPTFLPGNSYTVSAQGPHRPVLQRVSDRPCGPFPRAGGLLQLRLCAPKPLQLAFSVCAHSCAPGSLQAQGCLSPSCTPLITRWCHPDSQPSEAASRRPVLVPGSPALPLVPFISPISTPRAPRNGGVSGTSQGRSSSAGDASTGPLQGFHRRPTTRTRCPQAPGS